VVLNHALPLKSVRQCLWKRELGRGGGGGLLAPNKNVLFQVLGEKWVGAQ